MDPKINIKIGLLLPFHINDDEQTQSVVLGGSAGVRMAMAQINALEIIPGATLTLIEKDSYPTFEYQTAITQAIVSTVSLIQEGVIGVIGDISSSWTALSALMTSTLRIPQCSFSANATSLADKSQYEYFFRTIPTDLLYADAILSFISNQQWTVFGILYPDNDLGRQLTQTLISKSKNMVGMVGVKSSQVYFDSGDTNNIHASIDTLMSLGSRIVLIASKDVDEIVSILTIAAHAGHINSETVWITMEDVTEALKARVSNFNTILHARKMEQNYTLTSTPYSNGAEQVAWTTHDLELIDYTSAFAGGVFTFVPLTNLTGLYAPFEAFHQKWQDSVNDANYVNYHTGLAYSCLMVMAHGLGQIVNDADDRNKTLYDLSTGQFPFEAQDMLSIYNATGLTGPQGPLLFDKNGDTTTGIYNFQNGSQVEIGRILGGTFDLFANPIYFDGTHHPPPGTPERTIISCGLSTPISLATASLAGVGILIALFILIIVLVYRKHHVFKSSSPVFCALELIGFMLSYASILVLFSYSDTLFNCFMLPITFYVSLSIILGTTMARNYSVYRIVNSIQVSSIYHFKQKMSHPMQMLKLVACILTINCFILTLWLIFAQVQLVLTSVSSNVSVATCSYEGRGHTVFITLLSAAAGIELCFSVFLAIRTKSFGGYSKHSEHKQLGVSVFNIFFSMLIGFIIFFMPTTDFYTRHYLTAMTILWASTFSMGVLFFPKLYRFILRKEEKVEDDDDEKVTMKHVMATLEKESSRKTLLWSQDGTFLLDTFGELLPLQYVFRYFPYLARWQMQHIVFFPQVHYFAFHSINSEKKSSSTAAKFKKTVFSYSHATIESNTPGAFVFRVHGSSGFYDLLVQVENQLELEAWCQRFKTRVQFKCNGNISTSSTAVDIVLPSWTPP